MRPKISVPDNKWDSLNVKPPVPIRAFKGENQLNAYSIPSNFATRTRNFTGAGFPALQVRPDFGALAALPGSGAIQGLGAWKDQELHVIRGGTWYKWSGTAWISIYSGFNTIAPVSFVNFQGNLSDIALIAATGVDVPRYYVGGASTTALTAPSTLNFIDQHDNRMYAADKNTINFGAFRKPNDWTTVNDAGTIEMETNTGEYVSGLRAGSRHLLAFKPSAVFELYGNNPASYTFEPVATDIGLLSHQASTVMQGMPYWVDRNSIYVYGGSRPRDDFAMPVRRYIELMNDAQADKVCAGSAGKTLYISMPSAGSADPDITLEYDSEFQTWYVWRDFAPLHYLSLGTDLYVGTAGGTVLQRGTGSGAGLPSEWVSPPIGSGVLAQRTKWYRMWYVIDIPVGSSVSIYLSKQAEGESWTLVKTLTSTSARKGRIIFSPEAVANADWMRFRITGVGPYSVQEIDYQERELPMGSPYTGG